MENSVKNRLIKFLNSEKIKKSQFCDMLHVHPNYIDNMRKSVSVEKLNSIAEIYPELNTAWLQIGKGEMLNNDYIIKLYSDCVRYLNDMSGVSNFNRINYEKMPELITQCNQLSKIFGINKLPDNLTEDNDTIYALTTTRMMELKQIILEKTTIKEDDLLDINTRDRREIFAEKEFEGKKPKSLTNTTLKVIDNEDDYNIAIDAGLKLLPEVNFQFAAGTVEIFNDPENIKRYWFLPDCKDCDGIAQMTGTSMLPTYPPGCFLALKRYFFNYNSPNEVPFGSVFAIVIEDEITGNFHGHIKILRRHKDREMSMRYWIARSLNNEEFDDFDIDISMVRGLWTVKQYVVNNEIL